MEPFHPTHGFGVIKIAQNGDCFYDAIRRGLPAHSPNEQEVTVDSMRNLVSEQVTLLQLEFYQLQERANPEEEWLDFLRTIEVEEEDDEDTRVGDDDSAFAFAFSSSQSSQGSATSVEKKKTLKKKAGSSPRVSRSAAKVAAINSLSDKSCASGVAYGANATSSPQTPTKPPIYRAPIVNNLSELKRYILRSGADFGSEDCLWADSFAHQVIADHFGFQILFVDLARSKDAFPFRLLAKPLPPNPPATHYIVLIRETIGHFNRLQWRNHVGGAGEKTWDFAGSSPQPQAIRILFDTVPLGSNVMVI